MSLTQMDLTEIGLFCSTLFLVFTTSSKIHGEKQKQKHFTWETQVENKFRMFLSV